MADGAFEYSVEFYDALYSTKDYQGEAAEVCGLIRQHLPSAQTILDIGSGTGRHAAEMERLGFRVTGVDLSPQMVSVARERAKRAESTGEFLVGDARNFRLCRTFDAAVSLFHVASYQTTDQDVRNFLATVAAHLSPGGVFVFDFWCAAGVFAEPPQDRVRRVRIPHGEIVRITKPHHRVAESIVDVNYEYQFFRDGSDECQRFGEVHHMRYFTPNEWRRCLSDAGMEMIMAIEPGCEELGEKTFNGMILARKGKG